MYVVLWKLVNPLLKFEDPRVTLGWIRSRSERRSQQLSRKPVLVHRWKLVDLNRLKWIVAQRVKWVGQHNWPLILRGRREELYIRAWSNGKLGGGGGRWDGNMISAVVEPLQTIIHVFLIYVYVRFLVSNWFSFCHCIWEKFNITFKRSIISIDSTAVKRIRRPTSIISIGNDYLIETPHLLWSASSKYR